MLRVVWVVAGGDQLAPAERPVVGVLAGLLVAEHADRVAGQDSGSEAALVSGAVATLGSGAAGLFGCGLVGGAAAAGGELRAAGHGADGECAMSGHR